MNLFLGTACLVFEQTFSAEKWQIPTPHHRATRAFDYWQMLVSAPTGPAVSPLGQLITEKDNYLAYGRASRRERTVFFFHCTVKIHLSTKINTETPAERILLEVLRNLRRILSSGIILCTHTHQEKESIWRNRAAIGRFEEWSSKGGFECSAP